MWIIWDILTVAIVLTFAAASYRKGFLHTVTRLVGSIGALLFSLVYSEPIARMIFDNYLRSSTLDLGSSAQHLHIGNRASQHAQPASVTCLFRPGIVEALGNTKSIPFELRLA